MKGMIRRPKTPPENATSNGSSTPASSFEKASLIAKAEKAAKARVVPEVMKDDFIGIFLKGE
jgi:hypothetical protein